MHVTTVLNIFSVCISVVLVLVIIVLSERRTVELNVDMVNELKNTISIGTSIGDFVACIYNAYGQYDKLASVSIPYTHVLQAYWAWSTNNNYHDPLFTERKYNKQLLTTLPHYLVDTWDSAAQYGYKLSYTNTALTVTKISDSYIRMSLTDEDFNNTTVHNLIAFILRNRNLHKLTADSFTAMELYNYYQYYLVIFKLVKHFNSDIELETRVKSIPVKYNGDTYRYNYADRQWYITDAL